MKFWYKKFSILFILLSPLAWLYGAVMRVRYFMYRIPLLKTLPFPVPVIVVGNITVGGTGKTPLVVAIAEHFKNLGYRPGIVSRGYGGKAKTWPQLVTENSDPHEVGDEPILLVQKTKLPMAVAPSRIAAVLMLLEKTNCNLVISDDGLQHLAMGRTFEIAVVDGERQFGNGLCLPAGPLREPVSRLRTVNAVVVNLSGEEKNDALLGKQKRLLAHSYFSMHFKVLPLEPVFPTTEKAPVPPTRVHAVAGIGNPERFFLQLEKLGFEIIRHGFSDHHFFSNTDLSFGDNLPIIMTEKDAVKCRKFNLKNAWYLPVEAQVEAKFFAALESLAISNPCAANLFSKKQTRIPRS